MRPVAILLLLTSIATAAEVKEKPITDEDRSHWAFRPPVRAVPPAVKNRRGVRNPIDHFVRRALDDAGLKPSPEASRETLIRRLTFDLIGLPPTPAEVESYRIDPRSDAYERVVDRLLASPHYGERWALHWLDLARYADTDGYEFDQVRPNAWRYRDWVVSALNRDVPYSEFVRLQIAGDEVAPDDPSAFVATGFNRCYPDMVDLNDQGLRRQNALNDITETTGLVFLGLTIGCARCHDHKFDPIRQSDFYRLQAVFTPARFRDDYPIGEPTQRKAYESRYQVWQRTMIELESDVIAIEAPARAALAATPKGATDDVVVALQKPVSQRTDRDVTLIYDAQRRDRRVADLTYRLLLGDLTNGLRLSLIKGVERNRNLTPPPLPQASGLDETTSSAAPTYLLKRGDFLSKGSVVEPGPPAVLATTGGALPAIARKASTGRRSALANWLASPTNPLTARVMVNRLWQGHFGRGLVATSSDFGLQGSEPTNQPLLDWLAIEFVERGWSLKSMHRLIVLSATYRQDSRPNGVAEVIDPTNDLLWRQNRQRLDGEAIRDALLSAAGTLNTAIGGPCVFPELPAELTKLSSKGAIWPVSALASDRHRRSLYVFTRRNLRYPFFEVFDRPDTNASCPRRPVSTIAPQALTLLNSKLSRDAASAFAARLGEGTKAERIDLAYRIALGRSPDATEARLASNFLDEATSSDFCLALLNLNEFIVVD